ncbi:MAG: bifunctional phosphopantothenoylcysteine decarboxylase/phosphopantothenate--cysteine ligase CoaBC [Flammeovirgaceae bacterium]
MLSGKKILLGVTGSIAAYKAAFLVRLLKKAGAEVKVIMTASASEFITPLTLSTLSENPVLIQFQKSETGEWNNHVELGLWADLMIVAPLSANTLGKMANGICDNLLVATYLSARCPVMACPAMDLDMYVHPSTIRNLELLKSYGNFIVDAEEGELASGLVGRGRMAEPEHIVKRMQSLFVPTELPLAGKHAMITAGPTHEHLDPVRFIGNNSSGKMGYAIAECLYDLGAEVTLISGPSNQILRNKGINLIRVTNAQEMFEVSAFYFPQTDIAIFSAAVADYTPKFKADSKIKKNDPQMMVELEKTKDIAKEMGNRKSAHQITVGFALETDNELEHAKDKLAKKNLDLIVLNSLKDAGAGFGHDTNKVTFVTKNGLQEFPLKQKSQVAEDIAHAIIRLNEQSMEEIA